ncbi:patatin-like phospholipase family protein [Marinicella sp. S1101]|uniref:patatin-like phospholipase family protein n=1 Tax=Marinicella marina TaxID=2996016 RepID=UPI002260A1BF|nr:patatin-like phospholipase family protein [Marinicella marina]MCX7553588.1 patatin-like phospholipase family protein [Marinicella marina]MDJ1140212.1 patatin-like phospholipase family protein [Marinicella marina]
MKNKSSVKVGLALGSGSARGMSHIGVIKALEAMGIKADIVAGCSVGSMVGASYATNNLSHLEEWALSMNESKVRSFLSLNFNASGFINSMKLKKLFEHAIGLESLKFKDMDRPFGAVATDLSTGKEVWLNEGSVHDALWSSMAFPGLFPSVKHGNKWLVDGGLVNPVPVSLCRAMGAEKVIAVNLNADIINSYKAVSDEDEEDDSLPEDPLADQDDAGLWDKTKAGFEKAVKLISADGSKVKEPKGIDVISNSIHIMSSHLTRSRLAGEPPDVLLQPRLTDVGLLELHKSKGCIEEGKKSVERMSEEIKFRIFGE